MRCQAIQASNKKPCLRDALANKELCSLHQPYACTSRPIPDTGDDFAHIKGQIKQLIKDTKANKLPAASGNVIIHACKALLSVAIEERKLADAEALEARLASLEAALEPEGYDTTRDVA